MTNVLLLCSGGVDSIVAGALLRERNRKVHLLHIDYGHVTAGAERKAISACRASLGNPPFDSIDLKCLRQFGSGSLITGTLTGGEEYHHRNLLLITVGAMIAAKKRIPALAIGIIDSKNAQFRDGSVQFLSSAASLLVADNPRLSLLLPLKSKTKESVMRLATRLSVPLHLTFSCNARADRHCWQCDSCLQRLDAESNFSKTK